MNKAVQALKDWSAANKNQPDIQSEADIAIQMIIGKRPNVWEKYSSLLFKLDRTLSQLEDVRVEHLNNSETADTEGKRCGLRAKAKAFGYMIGQLAWIRARNTDLLEIIEHENTTTGSIER